MAISSKERYLAICRFERPGDLFYVDSFEWPQTLYEWVKQGAPEKILDGRFRREYFGYSTLRWLQEISSGLMYSRGKVYDIGYGIKAGDWGAPPIIPGFIPKIVAEDDRTITMLNGGGQTVRYLRENTQRMPTFIDWPVKDRASWNNYKKRLDPSSSERYPGDWTEYVEKINKIGNDYAISLQVGGLFGYLREWTGEINLLYMFHDDPGLVEDMMDTMVHLEIEIAKRVLKDIKVHQATYWEDMCYRSGPLISPDMVKKFMAPRYRMMNDLLRSHGVEVIWLDCDGNIDKLLPIWIDCGINALYPFEVAAGNDAIAVRKKYGKTVVINGAIDKRALIKGKQAIRDEVIAKVPFLLSQSGFVPQIDHNVPPDVTFENYRYYIDVLREVAGLPKLTYEQ